MVKKFSAPCSFDGTTSNFTFWLSDDYKIGNHPLFFQTDWLSKTRGGILDQKISEGIMQIAKIAEQNKISFEYLFVIAMDAALKSKTNEKPNDSNLKSNGIYVGGNANKTISEAEEYIYPNQESTLDTEDD
jgi:hypothetical protein